MNTHRLLTIIKVLWAMPCTAVGACLGIVILLVGGKVQRDGHVFEFALASAAKTQSLASGLPFSAITFGHVILGTSEADLDRLRTHELVHVRQYEILGAFFFIAYPLASLVAWLSGRCPYRCNRFEVAAYEASRLGSSAA